MTKTKEALIAIDPSLTGLAVCVLYCSGRAVMRRFTSEAAPGLPARFRRYRKLTESVLACFDGLDPAAVLIEGYSYGSRGRATLSIAEFGGCLRRALLARTAVLGAKPPLEIAPSTLKKFVTGKGNASKIKVISSICKRYGVEYDTDDEYDAYGLAMLGGCALGWIETTAAYQRAEAKTVRHALKKGYVKE